MRSRRRVNTTVAVRRRSIMKIDVINQWLLALQSVAIIVGVGIAIWQLFVFSDQTRIQSHTLKQAQQAASATLVLQLRDKLDGDKYSKITNAIQTHNENYPLTSRSLGGRGGHFNENEIDDYIVNFEDIGYLVDDGVIISKMAYDHFSTDIEDAWCNADVQRLIRKDRETDTSNTARSDPFYGHFEELAQEYLARQGQTCKDLDN